jgi:cephalosporin-C deacetylase-like acetyl esterase
MIKKRQMAILEDSFSKGSDMSTRLRNTFCSPPYGGLRLLSCAFFAALLVLISSNVYSSNPATPPEGEPLTLEGDIASQLVEGVDRFLLGEIEAARESRLAIWNDSFAASVEGDMRHSVSLESYRSELSHILGIRDPRIIDTELELVATIDQPALIAENEFMTIHAVRWAAFADVHAEGLLLTPKSKQSIIANIVAIPDASLTPKMITGLIEGVPQESQFARRLAENGCRVLVPMLINRDPIRVRNVTLTHREYVYRPAFELGRHIIGYELQKIFAGIDCLEKVSEEDPIGVFGHGEGGMLALYAGALDERIQTVCVSGYFEERDACWQEPLDRNVFGRLKKFGDAELAAMIAPRELIIEACSIPEFEIPPGTGGAPAILSTPELANVQTEFDRIGSLRGTLPSHSLIISGEHGNGPCGTDETLSCFLNHRELNTGLMPTFTGLPEEIEQTILRRHERQLHELVRHNERLLTESPYVRTEFMADLDVTSIETHAETVEPYREYFRDNVIGNFDHELLPPNPRIRQTYDEDSWVGYEVVLDVYPDVIAYGILLIPRDIEPGEQRPVVVCQHGLEGRPQDLIKGDHRAYHDFAARLTDRGFITFSPQNLYIFGDRFRTLQRKANPIGKTLFSVIVPQHQQIVNWLSELPQVDSERIGFYGLSYGGKSAMRIPPLVDGYCLSICSGDFNEWVWKNASTRSRYSYIGTGEYEIFEFDLGSTFNYAEMAALIAPRPFMVERGHFDGVAPDETVAYEFAKVRHLYNAKLGIGDRCELEWFIGPHTINGQGTFEFLHRHLVFPSSQEHALSP